MRRATWRRLMLALSECDPSELSSEVLCGLARMFLDLGAAQIRRDK